MPSQHELSKHEVRELVRRVVGRALAERGRGRHPAGHAEAAHVKGVHVDIRPRSGPTRPTLPKERDAESEAPKRGGAELVTTHCLANVPDGGTFRIPMGARVTPLARDEAWRRRIRLAEGGPLSTSGVPGRLRVALGSDHGGFETKVAVNEWLQEAGHQVLDLGTHDENAVDYPDFARAVAEAVANGQADLGVCVDGAGIGSAMAANKVPGVRAANGWNVASAKNAREHNYANVLTLGGRMLEPRQVFEILQAFLTTPEGPERHARRVEKITAIERRYSRSQKGSTT
jgi:ribose 5-phosphate isomerase B